jgi:hypothetical protein
MMQHHNYSLEDIEKMIPWERDLYVTMLIDHLDKEKERMEQEKQQQGN